MRTYDDRELNSLTLSRAHILKLTEGFFQCFYLHDVFLIISTIQNMKRFLSLVRLFHKRIWFAEDDTRTHTHTHTLSLSQTHKHTLNVYKHEKTSHKTEIQ